MNVPVRIMLALRKAPTMDLSGWPTGVKQAMQTLQTAAKSDAAGKIIADMFWERRKQRLAADGVVVPEWTKPSLRGTPEGEAARKAFLEARRPVLTREEARSFWLANRRLTSGN